MDKPQHLFLLGAAKCGTTALYSLLNQHPDICMSLPKEPAFFEAEFEKGRDYYLSTYFSHWSGQRFLGDSRNRNLYLPFVPERIKTFASAPRFVVVVRQPVERAISHWWHWHVRGEEPLGFEAAIDDNYRRLNRGPSFESPEEVRLYAESLNYTTGFSPYRSYIDSGYYAAQIKRYDSLFGQESIKVVFFEDLIRDPRGVASDIMKFLGVQIVNVELTNTNEAESRYVQRIMKFGRAAGLNPLISTATREKIKNIVQKLDESYGLAKSKIDESKKAELLKHFDPTIVDLESYSGINLDSWRL